MNTNKLRDLIAYSFLFIFALAIFIYGLSIHRLQSELLPLLCGGLIMFLSALGLLNTLRLRGRTGPAAGGIEAESAIDKALMRKYLVASVWLLGLMAAIYILGMLIALLVYMVVYMKTHNRRWSTSIIGSVITMALIFIVFQVAVKIQLYPGLLLTALFE